MRIFCLYISYRREQWTLGNLFFQETVFPALPPLQQSFVTRSSAVEVVLLAAGSPRGSWRFVCKPPLQKRSGSAVGGVVHGSTLLH